MSKKFLYLFKEGHDAFGGDQTTMKNILGGKGAGLAEMTHAGMPVPQGFTITTEACTQYYADNREINDEIKADIFKYMGILEEQTGKKFGDIENPLLVSVRSGARQSMPGMMDTILNLGLNDQAVEGLAKKTSNPRFAYDCYRRFIQMYSDVVMELGKSFFEERIDAMKERKGVKQDVELDANDLFTADSVTLEDIRIFKGGRIDRAILYAASVLNESHGTLKGLFRQIVEERTDILFPVKDLEQHHGLGFSAWCDNNRILIGTRRYLEQEGVPLPDEEYEMQHSKNGELQILYLAVSGNLHAMFVLKYVGGRNVARGLAVLQKENIRLLVTCQDPSLTAHHITEAYRLPEGMITVLDQEQCNAIKAAPEDPEDTCCMIHLKAFASLTGGLQAADQAQNAESSATTVQMVSVLFSIIIAALLTSAGSIWELSVATVLMYQAAWSALSIAVCALKQHN